MQGAPRTPMYPADALLTPTVYIDAVAGVRATTKKLVAAFGGIEGPTRGEAATAAATSLATAAILSRGSRPTTPTEVTESVAAHQRAVVDILRAEYVNRFHAPTRAALDVAAAAAEVNWEHPPPLADAAATVARGAAGMWLYRGPAVGTLSYRYRPPIYRDCPGAPRPNRRGGKATAAAAASVLVERPPPTAAQLRTHSGILWVKELPVPKRRIVVTSELQPERVVAAYQVGVAPNRVGQFPYRYGTAWVGSWAVPAGSGRNGPDGCLPRGPPATGTPPPVPRQERHPPVLRQERHPPVPRVRIRDCRVHRNRQLVRGSCEDG